MIVCTQTVICSNVLINALHTIKFCEVIAGSERLKFWQYYQVSIQVGSAVCLKYLVHEPERNIYHKK